MRAVCDEYGQPVLYVSYADPAATDARSGQSLLGWCYLAAGFFYVGETRSQRWAIIDHLGRARSTRQGAITLSRSTLPRAGDTFHGELITATWRMAKLPPARIWIAIVIPDSYSRRQAKHAWRQIFASLRPAVAARVWISHRAWGRRRRAGIVPIGQPRPQHLRRLDRFQPAWWTGRDIARTAAPLWVPVVAQQRLVLLDDVEGEVVGGRVYEPLS